ncbi:unnamed protein product [Polarella glacialis]|uniref:Peptidase C1A papain C-terminal domain-containing protein n=1 Tax=Polarella glacialis TaxID=89957 RepID=A0A813EN39_POLGL|nr:unnamed protein product [Polarella glacialis]
MRKGRFPDVMLARQVLINCVPANDPKDPPPGCLGGDSAMIHNYLTHSKVPDETCMPYQAANMGCAADTICRNCLPGDAGCWAVDSWTGYGVSLHGNVKGEEAMMKEIYARGPIACGFATDMAFMLNFSQTVLENEGVYQTSKNLTADNIDHNMEVAGWGVTDSGVKYWVVRNSWGTYWGDAGWFKLLRGENMIMVEHDCYWAVPTFDELDETLSGRVLGDYVRGISEIKPANKTLAAVLAGPPKPGTLLPLETSAAIACATFIAGAAVAYLAARRTGVKLNPLLG